MACRNPLIGWLPNTFVASTTPGQQLASTNLAYAWRSALVSLISVVNILLRLIIGWLLYVLAGVCLTVALQYLTLAALRKPAW